MTLYEQIVSRKAAIAVVGLGYVGLPLAVAIAKKAEVIGFDVNVEKIALYQRGVDVTCEVGDELKGSTCRFTAEEADLNMAKFLIVTVPTPIKGDKTPDLTPILQATEAVARHLTEGSVVVYESTVYPGVTENVCAPLLEKISGLRCGTDFFVGYSPERVNPGDKEHRLENITKIVSGQDEDTLDTVARVYELVTTAGVYRTPSIQVAEAAKVAENAQRDINIAFVNELAMAFDRMGIDTLEVLRAMDTKWNALGFYPGLVGGHCIGVDPYYFLHRAEELGFHSQTIAAGRRVNDDMPRFVIGAVVRELVLADRPVKGATMAVLGITFKADCQDARNSKMVEIVRMLTEYGVRPMVIDPVVDATETLEHYGITCLPMAERPLVDAVLFGVDHSAFRSISLDALQSWYTPGANVLIDIKGIFDRREALSKGFAYWRL